MNTETNALPALAGQWAIHPDWYARLAEHVQSQPARDGAAPRKAAEVRVEKRGGGGAAATNAPGYCAVIYLAGLMSKSGDQFGWDNEISTRKVGAEINAAAADPQCKGICLVVDSPGGTADGTAELADAIAAAAAKKPTIAAISGMACSAAYWCASQCDEVYATAGTDLIGSIGAFATMADFSRMVKNVGIEVHVIKSTAAKGAGTFGTPITDEQKAEVQRMVDGVHAMFRAAVKSGREMDDEELDKVADARVHLAAPAQELGLIDGIKPMNEIMGEMMGLVQSDKTNSSAGGRAAALVEDTAPTGPETERSMSGTNGAVAPATTGADASAGGPVAATLEQLMAACPKADSDFLVKQLGQKATVAQATASWMSVLADRTAAAEAKAAEAVTKAQEAEAKGKLPGVKPVGTAGGGASTGGAAGNAAEPIAAFEDAVKEKKKTGLRYSAAVAAVVKENPALHWAYVEAVNHAKPEDLRRYRERAAEARGVSVDELRIKG